MKLVNLTFEKTGCCGEVEVATVESGAAVLHIYREGEGYRIMKTVGGVFHPPMLPGLGEVEVDAVLAEI